MKQLQTIFISISLFVSTATNSAVIVDTGPGPANSPALSMGYGQYLAGEFSVDTKTTLTDIEGWIWAKPTSGGRKGIISLYNDGGEVPGNIELYTDTYLPTGASEATWIGIHNISWEIDPGTYWVSFEGRLGTEWIFGASMPYSSVNPLENQAFRSTDQYGDLYPWSEYDGLNFGVRISGDIAPVPIPAAAWLFGSGLLGLVAMARRKKV